MLFVQFTIYIDQIVSPNQLVVLDPYDAIVLVDRASVAFTMTRNVVYRRQVFE